MDREELFQALHKKEFQRIITLLKTGKDLAQDTVAQGAISHFFNELLTPGNLPTGSDPDYIFTQLHMLHEGKFFFFPDHQLEVIVTYICKTSTNPSETYDLAKKYPTFPLSSAIIKHHEDNAPREMNHTQTEQITVKAIAGGLVNLTTSIFNSKQERLFFVALRNCFPNHFIYPNAALSTIINTTLVKDILGPNELKFFYNTTVDFVLIDQFDDFKPVLAIELDSEWHRLNNQNEKDVIKNKIFKAAGLLLFRIEHFSKYKSLDEFERAIVETIQSRNTLSHLQ